MDPTRRMTRPGADYHGRGNNPADVPRRREQQEAERDFKAPGTRVPNNPINAKGVEMELAQQQGLVRQNLYLDGRGTDMPGTGASYQRVKLTPAQQRMMSMQPQPAAETLQDQRWWLGGAPSHLSQEPSQVMRDPGLAGSSPRAWTGTPAGPLIAASAPPQMNAASYQTLMPADADAAVTAMVMQNPASAKQTLGDPYWATLPRPDGRAGAALRTTKAGTPSMPPPMQQ